MPPKNKNKGKKGGDNKPLDAIKDNFADKLGIQTDDNDTQANTSMASQETPTSQNQTQIDFTADKDQQQKEVLAKQEEEKKSDSKVQDKND